MWSALVGEVSPWDWGLFAWIEYQLAFLFLPIWPAWYGAPGRSYGVSVRGVLSLMLLPILAVRSLGLDRMCANFGTYSYYALDRSFESLFIALISTTLVHGLTRVHAVRVSTESRSVLCRQCSYDLRG